VDEEPQTPKEATPRERSALLLSAFILSIVAIILGVVRFQQSLYPKPQIADIRASSASFQPNVPPDFSDFETLSKKDTDEDGLNDYDELNRYATSPYLADSDSDGVSDSDEITEGEDPNCPTGEDCANRPSTEMQNSVTANDAIGLEGIAVPDFSPELMRTILRGAGISDEQLVEYTDDDLGALYARITEDEDTEVSVAAPPQPDASPDEIRELLRKNGVSDDLIGAVDDETLLKLFSENTKTQ
jgi:hypothetical protein